MRSKSTADCGEVRCSPAQTDLGALRTTICEEVAVECAQFFGRGLRSIVLTGSLARDEATFKKEEDGWALLGDADYLLVLRKGADLPHASEVNSISQAVEARLRGHGINARVGLNMVLPSYFSALPRHIFTYELRSCGRVIWGDSQVLRLVPEFASTQISHEDAWRTLCHRIIELLACLREAPFPIEQLDPALRYAVVKFYLDMATSYLVFLGHYAPTYAERELRLRALAESDTAASNCPFSLKEFSQRISECTEWKLSGPREKDFATSKFLEEAIGYGQLLWRWEAIQLAFSNRSLAVGALCESVARQQTVAQRLRGWLSAMRRTDRFGIWREWPRWARLGLRATPRYLTYRVAVEVFWWLPCLLDYEGEPAQFDLEWDRLRALLPALPPGTSDRPPSWRDLIADVVWNYKQFLLGTWA
jgi:hypothetical protein